MSNGLIPVPDFGSYVKAAMTTDQKICRLEEIIAIMYDSLAESALNQDISEYRMDDGQTKVQSIYRSASQITNAIEDLERLVQFHKNKSVPRTTVLRSHEQIRQYK